MPEPELISVIAEYGLLAGVLIWLIFHVSKELHAVKVAQVKISERITVLQKSLDQGLKNNEKVLERLSEIHLEVRK